jgi:hypothetical protein
MINVSFGTNSSFLTIQAHVLPLVRHVISEALSKLNVIICRNMHYSAGFKKTKHFNEFTLSLKTLIIYKKQNFSSFCP